MKIKACSTLVHLTIASSRPSRWVTTGSKDSFFGWYNLCAALARKPFLMLLLTLWELLSLAAPFLYRLNSCFGREGLRGGVSYTRFYCLWPLLLFMRPVSGQPAVTATSDYRGYFWQLCMLFLWLAVETVHQRHSAHAVYKFYEKQGVEPRWPLWSMIMVLP